MLVPPGLHGPFLRPVRSNRNARLLRSGRPVVSSIEFGTDPVLRQSVLPVANHNVRQIVRGADGDDLCAPRNIGLGFVLFHARHRRFMLALAWVLLPTRGSVCPSGVLSSVRQRGGSQ